MPDIQDLKILRGLWVFLDSDELTSEQDVISLTWAGSEKEIIKLHVEIIPTGDVITSLRMGDASIDSGLNYQWDRELVGSGSNTGDTEIQMNLASSIEDTMVFDITIYNTPGQIKTVIWQGSLINSASSTKVLIGAGAYKTTSANIDRIDIVNLSTGGFVAGSRVEVLGRNFGGV